MRTERHDGKMVFVCACGLGYDDVLIAYACEDYKRTHGVNSEDITKRATYNSKVNADKHFATAPYNESKRRSRSL